VKTLGFVTAFCLLTGLLMAGAARYMGQHLPHRPVDTLTNWGQGRAPESNRCPPGTIRFETDDGFFLECFRANQGS
jgi:hypothetical protein